VRFARKLKQDMEKRGCQIDWKQSSFVVKMRDPGESGQRLSLLVVPKDGQTYIRRKLQESISFEISEVAHRRELMRELKRHIVLHFKDWYQDIDKLDFGPYYWMNNRY